jgi:hypothetical protein
VNEVTLAGLALVTLSTRAGGRVLVATPDPARELREFTHVLGKYPEVAALVHSTYARRGGERVALNGAEVRFVSNVRGHEADVVVLAGSSNPYEAEPCVMARKGRVIRA